MSDVIQTADQLTKLLVWNTIIDPKICRYGIVCSNRKELTRIHALLINRFDEVPAWMLPEWRRKTKTCIHIGSKTFDFFINPDMIRGMSFDGAWISSTVDSSKVLPILIPSMYSTGGKINYYEVPKQDDAEGMGIT